MSDFPGDYDLWGAGAVFSTATALSTMNTVAPASTAWPAANRALFIPIRVPRRVIVYKLVTGAGATATGNFDVGIYDIGGNRIIASGATAKGASVEHIINITDTAIGPGLYYLAMSADGTNNYAMISPGGSTPVPEQKNRLAGVLQMASAYVLPSTATFAACSTIPIPVIAAYTRYT